MKIACVYHRTDLDGIMSGTVVLHWFKTSIENKSKTVAVSYHMANDHAISQFNTDSFKEKTSIEMLYFIGYTHGDDIPDLSMFDKVIMGDISFPKDEMIKLTLDKGFNFIWNDHHISSIKKLQEPNDKDSEDVYIQGLRDTRFAACELSWKYFFPNEPVPEIVEFVGLYDSFRFVNFENKQEILYFQFGLHDSVSSIQEMYNIFLNYNTNVKNQILQLGEQEYNKKYEEATKLFKENAFGIKLHSSVKVASGDWERSFKFLALNTRQLNPKVFNLPFHNFGYDGFAIFYFTGNIWKFTLYSEQVDVSIIAGYYGGGGHEGAAGFELTTEEFFKLMSN